MTHVPYRGGAPAIQSVMAGDTQVTFGTSPTVLPQASSGRLRAIAVSTRERSPLVPDLPGMREAGLPEYHLEFWYGVFAPAGTPPAILRKPKPKQPKMMRSLMASRRTLLLAACPIADATTASACTHSGIPLTVSDPDASAIRQFVELSISKNPRTGRVADRALVERRRRCHQLHHPAVV